MEQQVTKTLTLAFVALAAMQNVAKANLEIKNQGDEKIVVAVLYTEIFSDSFVHHRKQVDINPGDSYTFNMNDVVLGRTANVFIYVPTHRANYFAKYPETTYNNEHFRCRVVEAPRYKDDFNRFGEQEITGPASEADFGPLRSARRGYTDEKALHIKPISRQKKHFEIIYKGFGANLEFDYR